MKQSFFVYIQDQVKHNNEKNLTRFLTMLTANHANIYIIIRYILFNSGDISH